MGVTRVISQTLNLSAGKPSSYSCAPPQEMEPSQHPLTLCTLKSKPCSLRCVRFVVRSTVRSAVRSRIMRQMWVSHEAHVHMSGKQGHGLVVYDARSELTLAGSAKFMVDDVRRYLGGTGRQLRPSNIRRSVGLSKRVRPWTAVIERPSLHANCTPPQKKCRATRRRAGAASTSGPKPRQLPSPTRPPRTRRWRQVRRPFRRRAVLVRAADRCRRQSQSTPTLVLVVAARPVQGDPPPKLDSRHREGNESGHKQEYGRRQGQRPRC
jgi:hypothetical protein